VGVVVGIAALVALAWFLPPVLRPTISGGGGGSWGPAASDATMVEATSTVWAEWPGFTLTEVGETPGAAVTGVWLVPGTYDATTPPDDAHRLPQRLQPGERATLVIHWRIEDCEQLAPRPEAAWAQEDELSDLGLRGTTIFGLPVAIRVGEPSLSSDWLSPAFDYEALVSAGICLTRTESGQN
jgi:hypothetical protein